MVIYSPKIVYLCALYAGQPSLAKAVVIYPFIILRDKNDISDWLLRHEHIHLRQQSELLMVGSLVLNLFEYFYARLILGKSAHEAYLWTSAEQEAYLNHHDETYLAKRKIFQRFKYFKNKKNLVIGPNGQVKTTS